MIGLSKISFELAFFPMLVLFIIVFWNTLNHVSDYSSFLKLFMALCLSMLCLVVIQESCIENPSSNVETKTAQPQQKLAQSQSQEPSEDFVGSMFSLIWLIFILIGSIMLILADDLPFMAKITKFMNYRKKPATAS